MEKALADSVDWAWVDLELDAAVVALGAGDAGPAVDLLAGSRGERRELCLDVLSEVAAARLEEVADAAESGVSDAVLLYGFAQVSAAWQVRGFAREAAPERAEAFVELVAGARETLLEAVAAADADPLPWWGLLKCAQADNAREVDTAYTELVMRAEKLYGPTFTRLQTLTPKWHGDLDVLLGFARSQTEDLPDGHPLLALLPHAHLEAHIDNQTQKSRLKRLWRGLTYLGSSAVRADVEQASERLLAGPVDHPRSLKAHQVFACYFHIITADLSATSADQKRLAAHMSLSGPRFAQSPWHHFGDAPSQFADARYRAGLR